MYMWFKISNQYIQKVLSAFKKGYKFNKKNNYGRFVKLGTNNMR